MTSLLTVVFIAVLASALIAVATESWLERRRRVRRQLRLIERWPS